MKIVVTGATGFIGKELVARLLRRGDQVTVLSRDAAKAKAALGNVEAVSADLQTPGPWTSVLAGADAVAHLAGESVGSKRWDAQQKQLLRDTRVESTRTIVEAIAAVPESQRPKTLTVSSGTDYYPFAFELAEDDEVTEADPPGDSFLARLCRDWEKEAFAAKALGLRVATMRTGLVMGPGEAFTKLSLPFKLFVGGRIGSGKQWTSWIHVDDAAGAFDAALHDERYAGPINLVTDSVRNKDFSKALGHALHRPSWLPVPGFALHAVAGELAEYILHGRRVIPARLRELGYRFEHATLADALKSAT